MMKRVPCLLLAAVMAVALLMTGCAAGISEEDYNRVVEERDQARAEVASLENELDQAQISEDTAFMMVDALEEKVAALEAALAEEKAKPVGEEAEPVGEEAEPKVAAGPPISFRLGDNYIRLIGDDLTPYGSELASPEQDSPWTITIKRGSTITITEVLMGNHPYLVPHIFAIEGQDIEVPLQVGVHEGPFEVTFNEVGTFEVYCKLRSADTYGGKCFIVVEE